MADTKHHPPHGPPDGARPRTLGDGFSHGLEPVVALDLSQCHSVDDLVRGMASTAFGGRAVGEAADVLYDMVTDEACFVVLTLSGAMTVAKMGLVICDMIEQGMVDAIISTGALMTHGLVESTGRCHFKYRPEMNDESLFEAGYNRVYDTLEPEQNLDELELVLREILAAIPAGTRVGSRDVCERIGRHLAEHAEGRGVLKSAYNHGVPVYVPAFSDSEMGLDVAVHMLRCERTGRGCFSFEPFLDLFDYAARIEAHEKTGIFTIGGGVPRNWAQQVAPYVDIRNKRLGIPLGRGARFHYGVRICPEPVHWGGLSGCTYSEGVSWGKFVPPSEGGRYAEVYSDATIAWPLVVKAVSERLAGYTRRAAGG